MPASYEHQGFAVEVIERLTRIEESQLYTKEVLDGNGVEGLRKVVARLDAAHSVQSGRASLQSRISAVALSISLASIPLAGVVWTTLHKESAQIEASANARATDAQSQVSELQSAIVAVNDKADKGAEARVILQEAMDSNAIHVRGIKFQVDNIAGELDRPVPAKKKKLGIF